MKKCFVLMSLVLCGSVAACAQAFITLGGNNFKVDLREQDKTAAIVDYVHEIDDAEFPIYMKTRKFKWLDSNHTLIIPETININGEQYTITSIGRAAFADYRNLEYVSIPETVVSKPNFACRNRTNIASIV